MKNEKINLIKFDEIEFKTKESNEKPIYRNSIIKRIKKLYLR